MRIWLDLITPKYTIFFIHLIPILKKRGYCILVTTRYAKEYREPKKLLEKYRIDHKVIGTYGGNTKEGKYLARLEREQAFVQMFSKEGKPDIFFCGDSVEGTHVAFGLGVPIVNFYDTPIQNNQFSFQDITILAKLTIPYAKLWFYPFPITEQLGKYFGLSDDQVFIYDFIDVCLWLKDIKALVCNDFRLNYNLDTTKPTILMREEEYKANYVQKKDDLFYSLIPLIKQQFDVNIIIMPRYSTEDLQKEFGQMATILDDVLKPESFYPFIDMLIGGGGTMNLEAAFFGIPVISTRSLFLYHDKFLLDNNLMHWSKNKEDILQLIKQYMGSRNQNAKEIFSKGRCSFEKIVDIIETKLEIR